MRLAFLHPDIPQNFGAAIRLGACFDIGIDIIEPCGFALTHKALRRVAMDYKGLVKIERHASWDIFLKQTYISGARIILFTTQAKTELSQFTFRKDDILLFGQENAGAGEDVHMAAHHRLRIAMQNQARSLNVAMSAGIALYHGLSQTEQLP